MNSHRNRWLANSLRRGLDGETRWASWGLFIANLLLLLYPGIGLIAMFGLLRGTIFYCLLLVVLVIVEHWYSNPGEDSGSLASAGTPAAHIPGTIPLMRQIGNYVLLTKFTRTDMIVFFLIGMVGSVGLWSRLYRVNENATLVLQPTRDNDILVLYDRSEEQWIKAAADDFKAKNPDYNLVLQWRSSGDGANDIQSGIIPALWSPADLSYITRLKNQNTGLVGDNPTILKSKFVLIMWEDRAKVFEAYLRKYPGIGVWELLHEIATTPDGWKRLDPKAAGGSLKMRQSAPTASNSGEVALELMYKEYSSTHSKIPFDHFVKWMEDIENAVPTFGDTTSRVVDSFIEEGQHGADVALAYEVNAFTALKQGAKIHIIYPNPTVDIEFPAANFISRTLSEAQRKGAMEFRNFLLQEDVQKRAIEYGFRQTGKHVQLPDLEAVWAAQNGEDTGFQLDPIHCKKEELADDQTMTKILNQWKAHFKRRF